MGLYVNSQDVNNNAYKEIYSLECFPWKTSPKISLECKKLEKESIEEEQKSMTKKNIRNEISKTKASSLKILMN